MLCDCVYVGGVVDVVECGLFLSLGVCGWIVSLCSGCVVCCDACRCCVLVSCVHPVAILRAVFCTICSLSRMHWVTIW